MEQPTAEEKKTVEVNFLEKFITMKVPVNLKKYNEYFKDDIEKMIKNHGGIIVKYTFIEESNSHNWEVK